MSAFSTFLKPINSSRNIYISGVGGTGKSYLLKELCKHFTDAGKICSLTSTTGVSAFNIGGQTIHSWCGVVIPEKIPEDIPLWLKRKAESIKNRKRPYDRIMATEILFIDEISMLGSSYLEILDWICKHLRGVDKPFGGIQIVCSGDMLQLPPVNDGMPFISEAWKDLNFLYYTLQKRHRFPDPDFADLLGRARIGSLTDADILTLNARVTDKPPKTTMIYPRRADVDRVNNRECLKIKSFEHIVNAEILEENMKGQLTKLSKPPQNVTWPLEPTIRLKIGAQVMLLVNIDVDSGLVNGTRGTVKSVSPDQVVILKDDGVLANIDRVTFPVEDGERLFHFSQLPLTLAWAVTIHKVQGCTLDSACIEIGTKIFSPGQAYVALSRCRTLEGLHLTERVQKFKVFADKHALHFEKTTAGETVGVDVVPDEGELCSECGKGFCDGEIVNALPTKKFVHSTCG